MNASPQRNEKSRPSGDAGPPEDEARRREREAAEREQDSADDKIDEAARESFPASDPPAWTPSTP